MSQRPCRLAGALILEHMAKMICKNCNEKFFAKPSANRKFCSRQCLYKSGILSIKAKSPERIKIAKANLPKRADNEHNGRWKGEETGLVAIHQWVRRQRGIPKKCQHCGIGKDKVRYIDWANVDHKYSRNLDDYMPLCRKCHFKYDSKHFGRITGFRPKVEKTGKN